MNERLQTFKNNIKNKKVALLGMGISNRAAVDFLLSAGAILSARDKNPAPDAEITEFLTSRGVKMIYGEGYLSDITEDIVFKSPGIRFDIPELVSAAENGVVITSEMEVFTNICPAKIFAVTGSDGKTTTTTLVAKMLEKTAEKTGAKVYLGGNIGTPLLPYVEEMTENDFAVLELSSFQLHTMQTAPVSAIVTNVTPNHLNWHTSMEEYVESKKNIYRGQTESCRLVLNANNEITASMADETRASVTFFAFGNEPKTKPCCYFENGNIYYDNGEKQLVMTRNDIRLVGDHNVENYMAAISAVWGYTAVPDMIEVARTFNGVAHRIELIAEKDGVKFYNSSIDTSPTRTLAALASFEEKLAALPEGILTPLTREFDKKGVELSGGESQKIAIARVFARDYDLMILDEPSSALDPIAEYELNRSILENAKDKTVIFISHRLSTTRMADRIYMFDQGAIVEVGSHDRLMAKNGKYAEMYRTQAKKYRSGTK